MDNIPFLTEANFYEVADRINYSDQDKLLRILGDMIDYAPFMSRIITRLILECIRSNPCYESAIRERIVNKSENQEINLSRCVYGACLGARTNLARIQQVSQIFSDLDLECREIEKHEGRVEVFFCSSILKRLSFNKKECILRLSMLPFDSIISAIQKDQSLFNISLMIQMCRYLGFLPELEKHIDGFEKKSEIIAMIFISFFSNQSVYTDRSKNESIEAEKQILARLITGEVLEYCLKVANRRFLGMLLKREFQDGNLRKISHQEFKSMDFNDKRDFFNGFLALTSPSISHFLSYLEIYKDRFVLNSEDQALLVAMIREAHANDPGYRDVAISKLQKFGIVSNKNL